MFIYTAMIDAQKIIRMQPHPPPPPLLFGMKTNFRLNDVSSLHYLCPEIV